MVRFIALLKIAVTFSSPISRWTSRVQGAITLAIELVAVGVGDTLLLDAVN
jgi:hypothetical protein